MILPLLDELVKKDGTIVEGNIVEINRTEGWLELDVVMHGELVGMTIDFKKDELIYIRQDGKYKGLVRKELTEKQVAQKKENSSIRRSQYGNVDQKIRNRIRRKRERMDSIDKRREDKRRFDEKFKQEQKLKVIQHEQRKDLMDHASSRGVPVSVDIIDLGY